MALEAYERIILSSTYGPTEETAEWRISHSKGIYSLRKEVTHTALRRLGIRWRHQQNGWMKNTKDDLRK
jgi:hypothetical protein